MIGLAIVCFVVAFLVAFLLGTLITWQAGGPR